MSKIKLKSSFVCLFDYVLKEGAPSTKLSMDTTLICSTLIEEIVGFSGEKESVNQLKTYKDLGVKKMVLNRDGQGSI